MTTITVTAGTMMLGPSPFEFADPAGRDVSACV